MPRSDALQKQSFIDAVYYFADCADPTQCRKARSASFYIKSAYAQEPYPEAGIDTLIDWLKRWPETAGDVAFEFDSYGGAVNRAPRTATAFVHREQLFVGQFQAYWDADESQAGIRDTVSWLNDFYEAIGPYNSGFAYQNYIDRNLTDWQHAYYGENLTRLKQVKRKYDPDDVFRFAQSIPIGDD